MSNSFVPIRSGNFVLRDYKNSDANALNELLKDKTVQFYIPGLSGGVNQLLILSKVNQNILFVLEDISTNKAIGFFLAYIDIDNTFSSIISAMNSKYRKQGLQKNMLILFIKYLREENLAKIITFRISVSNKQALNVMKSLQIPFLEEEDNMCLFRLSLAKELPF